MTDWAIGRSLRIPGAAALLLAISGCSGMFGEPNEVAASCPTTGVLQEAETLDRYRPGTERDLTDLQLRAHVGNIRHACSVLRDTRTLEMDLMLQVLAERGPAAPAGQQDLAYFVAVADDHNNILNRQTFPLAVDFQNSARQTSFSESLLVTVPIPPDKVIQDMRVYVGLQLTPEELERAWERQRSRP